MAAYGAVQSVLGDIASTTWIEQFGTLSSDGATSVAVDAIGNVYIAGYTEGSFAKTKSPELFINNDALVAKYSSDGKLLWKQQIGNVELDDGANAIAVAPDGNVYITGYTYDAMSSSGLGGMSDAFLAKLSSSGELLWQGNFGSAKNDSAHAIAIDKAGNVYVAGEIAGYGSLNLSNADGFLAKFDEAGDQLWSQPIDISKSDSAYGVAVDGTGNIYVVGSTGGSIQGTTIGFTDGFITKFDSSGNRLWTDTVGLDYQDKLQSVAIDSLGNVYAAGSIQGGLGELLDVLVVKYSADGTPIWGGSVEIPGSEEIATGIAIDASNNLYVTGYTTGDVAGNNTGTQDAFLIRLDADGNIIGEQQLGDIGTDIPTGVTPDIAGNIYITGWTEGTLGSSSQGYNDYFLVKYGDNPLPTPPVTSLDISAPSTSTLTTSSEVSVISDPPVTSDIKLTGTNRTDRLNGTAANDVLLGLGGNDKLLGLDGDDHLYGGGGNDTLNAGAGNDYLDGGEGDDRLMGGEGLDQFVLRKGKNIDLIQGFQDGQDRLILPRGTNVRKLDLIQIGNKAAISIGNDVLAVLTGIRANQLSSADFTKIST